MCAKLGIGADHAKLAGASPAITMTSESLECSPSLCLVLILIHHGMRRQRVALPG